MSVNERKGHWEGAAGRAPRRPFLMIWHLIPSQCINYMDFIAFYPHFAGGAVTQKVTASSSTHPGALTPQPSDTNEYPALNATRHLLASKRYESTGERRSRQLAERAERPGPRVVWSGHTGAVKGRTDKTRHCHSYPNHPINFRNFVTQWRGGKGRERERERIVTTGRKGRGRRTRQSQLLDP